MFKALGAVLVFVSVLCCGTYPILCKMSRLRVMSEFVNVLERMKLELRSVASPLPQMLAVLIADSHGTAKVFLNKLKVVMDEKGAVCFYDEWKRLTQYDLQMLNERERTSFLVLGDMLGCYVAEDQVEALERTISIFQEGVLTTREFIRERLKLYLGVSVSVGLLVVIVLL